MAGLIGIGRGLRSSATAGFGRAADLEEGRNRQNEALEAAEKQQQVSTTATGAGTGAMIGMQYGSVGGVPGAAVGAVIGGLAGLLGSKLF